MYKCPHQQPLRWEKAVFSVFPHKLETVRVFTINIDLFAHIPTFSYWLISEKYLIKTYLTKENI